MKNQSLTVFCITLIIFSVLYTTCTRSKSHSKAKANAESTIKNKANAPLRGYYFIQRFYPGADPIDNIKESEFHTREMFFELNSELLFFSKSLERIDDVEDSVSVSELYDVKVDDAANGKCCSRLVYHEFPAGKGLDTILVAVAKPTKKGQAKITPNKSCVNSCNKNPLTSVSKSSKELKKSKVSPRLAANFCLDIWVPEEARWRICSTTQDKISKLHMKLLFNILEQQFKGKASLIASALANARVGREVATKDWTWESQAHWEGYCKSSYMQSPINILKQDIVQGKKGEEAYIFGVNHHLLPVSTMIKRNFKEVIVAFMNYGGLFQVTIDNTYLLFTPVYMSFKFPGEHLINGERPMGELVLNFAEMSTQRKTSATNGLLVTIPIKPTMTGLNIDAFEHLNIDFWKYEIQKKGTYIPKKFLKKKLLSFDLGDLMKKVQNQKPNVNFYMGSQTTPPCAENTYHIVFDKPLEMAGCQFKLLRDNSIFSTKAKEIHSRLDKPINGRSIYHFASDKISYLKNIDGLTPQSFNKYLFAHGYNYHAKRKGKFGDLWRQKRAGRKLGGKNGMINDLWLDEVNCDVPTDDEQGVPNILS